MSHNKHRYHACVWLVGAVLACANGGVAAQSLESGVFIGVSNLDYGGDMSILALGYDTSSGGLAAAELAATSFSGDSGAGFPETMIFSGGGSAFVVEPACRSSRLAVEHVLQFRKYPVFRCDRRAVHRGRKWCS